jgi:hypothetical protein
MHTTATLTRKFEAWWCGMLPLLSNGGVAAQQSPSPLKAEEIDALFAPIAPYVDALLTKMAMARLGASIRPLRSGCTRARARVMRDVERQLSGSANGRNGSMAGIRPRMLNPRLG